MTRLALADVMFAAAALMFGGSAWAAELVMFEEPGCVWCRRWHAEIGPGYPLSPEGRTAPLRRVHIGDQAAAGVLLQKPVTATPTFVLAEDGREVGRIVGYPGSEFFYGLLASCSDSCPGHRLRSAPPRSRGRLRRSPDFPKERAPPNDRVVSVAHEIHQLGTTLRD